MFGERRKIRPRPGMPLPEIEPVTPPYNPVTAPPGRDMPPSDVAFDPPTRQQRYETEKAGYMRQTPGRLKSGLLGAVRGSLEGLREGGLAGALGGAVGGGVGAAINPRGLRRQRFEEEIAPQIRRQFAYEDFERQQQRQAQRDELDAAYKTAQIGAVNRSNLPEPPKSLGYGDSPLGIYSRDTGQVTAPAPPKEERYVKGVGRNRKTGRYETFNAANKSEAANYDAIPPLQRPRATAAPKQPKQKKTIAVSELREWAEENKMSTDRAAAKWKADGFEIVRAP